MASDRTETVSRRTKVLHVLAELRHSGAEVMVRVADRHLSPCGVDSVVVGTGETLGAYAEPLRLGGITVLHVPFGRSFGFFRELHRVLRTLRPEVVHIHMERAFFWVAFMAWVDRVPTIIRSVHGVFRYRGLLRFKRTFQRLVARKLFGVKFVAISDSVRETEARVLSNRASLIWNWIDSRHFRTPTIEEKVRAREFYGFRPQELVLLSVGRCDQNKNHIAVIQALRKIHDKGLVSVRYLHHGKGPTLEEERQRAYALDLAESIVFGGYTDDIREAYWAADLFVMTSGWEGLGNVILEAMACGLPAVLYDVIGMKDVLRHGKGGILVDPNPDCLADVIADLVRDKQKIQNLRAEAPEVIRRDFDEASSIKQLRTLYRSASIQAS